MRTITITCPITWHERIDWIRDNCNNYTDLTNWGMWQIGQDYIYFQLEDKDATWFTMRWGS